MLMSGERSSTVARMPARKNRLITPRRRTGSGGFSGGGSASRRYARVSHRKNSASTSPLASSHCGHRVNVQKNSTPRRKPRNNGGAPPGGSKPPPLLTPQTKNNPT